MSKLIQITPLLGFALIIWACSDDSGANGGSNDTGFDSDDDDDNDNNNVDDSEQDSDTSDTDGDGDDGDDDDDNDDNDSDDDDDDDTEQPDSGPSSDGGSQDFPIRVMPLGDSITLGYGSNTEGVGSEGGYRLHLAELLYTAGIDFDFVGSQVNGPAALSDRDHEGYNGYAVPQVAEITPAALDAYQPDVVLLMAGTNDQINFVPPSQTPIEAAADLETLIEDIDARISGIQIIVAQLVPLSLNDSGIIEYNALLPDIVSGLSEQGINVRLVDMHVIGTENISLDGIHPTNAGYDLIADIWYPALIDAIADM